MTDTHKLQSALIETGKEVEAMKETPEITEIETAFYQLETANYNNDMKQMRKACRRLAALATKFMIEKL
jgi:hypothetical protein